MRTIMSETTQKERDAIRYVRPRCFMPLRIHERLVNDADRLARLEQQVRELADDMGLASTRHYERWRKGASQYHEGRSDQAEEDANLVYALINPPAIREAGEEDA